MANWSGSFSITAGEAGTLTAATATTATNSGATWPTGAQGLTNFYIRLLTGTGAPATVLITGNSANQVTVASWPSGTPDTSTTYEIVLILKNLDHVTADLTLGNRIITELEDSATILVDGVYAVALSGSSTVRWNKSESTIVTFCANNRTVQGKHGFWSYISIPAAKTTIVSISYLRLLDSQHTILSTPGGGVGDATTIHHVWSENLTQSMAYGTGATLSQSLRHSNFFSRNSSGGQLAATTSGTGYTQIFEKIWAENAGSGGCVPSTGGASLLWDRDSVYKWAVSGRNANVSSGKEFRMSNIYQKGSPITSGILMGPTTSAAAGTYTAFHNFIRHTRALYAANMTSTSVLQSHSNDLAPTQSYTYAAFDIGAATSFATATSRYDCIAGNAYASPENIDTTALTTSTANPSQYKNLTANRVPKSAFNFTNVIDNVSIGTPTANSVTITFDCANGAEAGQKTAVNVDSASGQPVLNVTSSTEFLPGMNIEVGYGTARSERGRIASVGSGTITLETNLTFTHLASDADVVAPELRHTALPQIIYGTSSGSYPKATPLPPTLDWGLYFTEIYTTYRGVTHTWKKTAHSITLNNLRAGTTYYFTATGYTPLDELLTSSEYSFTTAAEGASSNRTYRRTREPGSLGSVS